MIITIDTAKDSPDEIQTAIQFLSQLIGASVSHNQTLPQEMAVTPQTSEVFSQLFDTPEQPLLSAQEPEKKDDVIVLPKVVTYTW